MLFALLLLVGLPVLEVGSERTMTTTTIATPSAACVFTLLGEDKARPTISPLQCLDASYFPFQGWPNTTLADVAARYHSTGATMLRTHDYNYALDLANVYPDPTLPPDEPGAMSFVAADLALDAILDAGFVPYLRVGNSGGWQPGGWQWSAHSDHWGTPNNTAAQHQNVANAMARLVEHASHRTQLKLGHAPLVAESWNEPNEPGFWNRAPPSWNMSLRFQEFEDLFVLTVAALRDLRSRTRLNFIIGGPGFAVDCGADACASATTVSGQGVQLRPFLARVAARGARVDFVSWHRYSNVPADFRDCTAAVVQAVHSTLGRSVAVHLSEWNLAGGKTTAGEPPVLNTTRGAALLTSAWIAQQLGGANLGCLYTGCCADFPYQAGFPFGGGSGAALFTANPARPLKPTALVITRLWRPFAETYHRRLLLSTLPVDTPLYALGGSTAHNTSSKRFGLLVSNPTNETIVYRLQGSVCCEAAVIASVEEVVDSSGETRRRTVAVDAVTVGAWATQLLQISPQH